MKQKNQKKSESEKLKMGHGINIMTELFSVPVTGFFIGLFLDNHFETKPICMIVFFILGIIAAFWNIFKMLKKNY